MLRRTEKECSRSKAAEGFQQYYQFPSVFKSTIREYRALQSQEKNIKYLWFWYSEGHRHALSVKWKSPGFLSLSVFSLHCMVFRTTKASVCTSNSSGSHAQGEPCWLAVCLYHNKDTLTQVGPRTHGSFSAKPFSNPTHPAWAMDGMTLSPEQGFALTLTKSRRPLPAHYYDLLKLLCHHPSATDHCHQPSIIQGLPKGLLYLIIQVTSKDIKQHQLQ